MGQCGAASNAVAVTPLEPASARGHVSSEKEDYPDHMNPARQPARIPFWDRGPHPKDTLLGRDSKLKVQIKVIVGEGERLEEEPEKSRKGSHHTCKVPKDTDAEARWDRKTYPKPHFLLEVRDN